MGGIRCTQTGSGRKEMEIKLPFFFRKKPMLSRKVVKFLKCLPLPLIKTNQKRTIPVPLLNFPVKFK